MNLPANRIDDALKAVQSLTENDPGFWNVSTVVPMIVGLIVILVGIFYLLYSTNNRVERKAFVIVIVGAAIFGGAGLSNVLGDEHHEKLVQAHAEVQEAYKASVVDNFRITESEMVNLELRPRTDDSNAYSEVNFEYTDLKEMTRYDLVFLFDEETNEPTLLKSGNVTEEIVEKLIK